MTLLIAATSAQAVDERYSPFEAGQKPKPFPVTVLTNVWSGDDSGRWEHFEFAYPGQTNSVISVLWTTNCECRLNLARSCGAFPFSETIEGSPVGGANAYAADLNRDGQTDYVIRTWTGGCGLAGQISFMTFVLSSPTGYVAHCVLCYDAEPSDLMDMNQEGKPVYLHAMFVGGEEGRDGRRHNYWVYNLLGFSGTDMISANSIDIRFPKWVWYKFKANHEDTNQLMAEQRTRLWLEAWKWESDVWKRSMFPNVWAFGQEQGKPSSNEVGRSSSHLH